MVFGGGLDRTNQHCCLLSGVTGVYFNLKSSIFVKADDLCSSGSYKYAFLHPKENNQIPK
jgi:hypothetical protein